MTCTSPIIGKRRTPTYEKDKPPGLFNNDLAHQLRRNPRIIITQGLSDDVVHRRQSQFCSVEDMVPLVGTRDGGLNIQMVIFSVALTSVVILYEHNVADIFTSTTNRLQKELWVMGVIDMDTLSLSVMAMGARFRDAITDST
ncbi:unnamed protein product [Ceratitis capitata]|uniref:(Mediterranean fruit fly) hypothetical protein n=1 Tax=Ceratitis capitata TaxID=7213 RepID=A0A811V3N7_CERCA|nr:unnamed protein product [Ceratitis capitata]